MTEKDHCPGDVFCSPDSEGNDRYSYLVIHADRKMIALIATPNVIIKAQVSLSSLTYRVYEAEKAK